MGLGWRIGDVVKRGLSRLPLGAQLRLRGLARQAKAAGTYLRYGEEALGCQINAVNDKLWGSGISASEFKHAKIPQLVADIKAMAGKAKIRVDEVLVRASPHGSPLSSDFRRIHIDPTHLDKYSGEELKAIARHELEHLKNKDVIRAALGRSRVDMETRADLAAVAESGEPRAYLRFMSKLRDIQVANIKAARADGEHAVAEELFHELQHGDAAHPAIEDRLQKVKTWVEKITEVRATPRREK
jgi:hypothetical protein